MKRLLILALLCATPAFADDESNKFRSPSGNILCLLETGDAGSTATCDILERGTSATPRPRPKDCDLEWGIRYSVGESGAPEMICEGDFIGSAQSPILTYGSTLQLGGIACSSSEAGVECRNEQGHGFSLSKAIQKLF